MPQRNWVNDITFGCLAVGILLAITVLCVEIIVSDYSKIEEVYAGYQRNADKDKHEADERIKSTCINIPANTIAVCVANELHAYYSKQATKADLQAQEDMAIWAKWMFVTSAAGIAVGVIGIFYVRNTFHEARETTRAALLGADAAIQANSHAVDVARTQLRAWMNFEEWHMTLNGSAGDIKACGFNTRWKNSGLTPATIRSISVAGISGATDGKTIVPDITYESDFVVGPGSRFATSPIVIRTEDIPGTHDKPIFARFTITYNCIYPELSTRVSTITMEIRYIGIAGYDDIKTGNISGDNFFVSPVGGGAMT